MKYRSFNLLYVLSVFILLILIIASTGEDSDDHGLSIALTVIGILAALLHRPILRSFQDSVLSKNTEDKAPSSSDEFLLYLRSFKSDGKRPLVEPMLDYINIIFFPSLLFRDFSNHEERIIKPFLSLGKPFALSVDPNEGYMGARRILTTNKNWEERFHQLCRNSQVIIIQIETTDSLLSEIEFIATNGYLYKTVLYAGSGYNEPGIASAKFNKFGDITQQILPVPLPKSLNWVPIYIAFTKKNIPVFALNGKDVCNYLQKHLSNNA